MFILTDGKNYVMENPMKQGVYLQTTSPIQAKEFTFKQARTLLNSKSKKMSWVKSFCMVDKETGELETDIPKYSNEGIFCGSKDFEFDESIVETIKHEVDSIIGLAAWDINQLNTYVAMLNQGVQFYDNAIQDIKHARLDKRPPAHIRTKIDGIMNDLEEILDNLNMQVKEIKYLNVPNGNIKIFTADGNVINSWQLNGIARNSKPMDYEFTIE